MKTVLQCGDDDGDGDDSVAVNYCAIIIIIIMYIIIFRSFRVYPFLFFICFIFRIYTNTDI